MIKETLRRAMSVCSDQLRRLVCFKLRPLELSFIDLYLIHKCNNQIIYRIEPFSLNPIPGIGSTPAGNMPMNCGATTK